MARKLDLDLAIYGGDCPRCNERYPLFIPVTEEGKNYPPAHTPYADKFYSNWNYLCENCMNELELEIDMETTKQEAGNSQH